MAARSRVKVPDSAAAGEVITLKTLVSHRMESGQRIDESGEIIPRDIVARFSAAFDGEEFFAVDLDTAIAANPFFEFPFRMERAGTFTFRWTDDAGETVVHEQSIELAS